MSARVLDRVQVDRFHWDGFLSIPQITTLEEVKRIRALYDRLFEDRAGWDKGDFFDFAGLDESGTTASVP